MENDDAGNSVWSACPPIMRDMNGRKEPMSTDHARFAKMSLLQPRRSLPIMRLSGWVDHKQRLANATDYARKTSATVRDALPWHEAVVSVAA